VESDVGVKTPAVVIAPEKVDETDFSTT